MKKEFYITHIDENDYLVNGTLVTIYRDGENRVMTNPILEPDNLNLLRHFIAECCIKNRNKQIQQ